MTRKRALLHIDMVCQRMPDVPGLSLEREDKINRNQASYDEVEDKEATIFPRVRDHLKKGESQVRLLRKEWDGGKYGIVQH